MALWKYLGHILGSQIEKSCYFEPDYTALRPLKVQSMLTELDINHILFCPDLDLQSQPPEPVPFVLFRIISFTPNFFLVSAKTLSSIIHRGGGGVNILQPPKIDNVYEICHFPIYLEMEKGQKHDSHWQGHQITSHLVTQNQKDRHLTRKSIPGRSLPWAICQAISNGLQPLAINQPMGDRGTALTLCRALLPWIISISGIWGGGTPDSGFCSCGWQV